MRRLPLLASLLGLIVVALSPVVAVEKEAIDAAVQRGVAALRKCQGSGGTWEYPGHAGATPLAALTLLECGVPPDDPIIQKAATTIRVASVNANDVYSLALSVLFFDRLGEPTDVPMIE